MFARAYLKHSFRGIVLKIAACQTPDIRADIDLAVNYIHNWTAKAEQSAADVVCFPECFVGGYYRDETEAEKVAINTDSAQFNDIKQSLAHLLPIIVFGLTERREANLYNAAIVLQRGKLIGRYAKQHLLNSEAFFEAGIEHPVFKVQGKIFGINICYDNQFPDSAAKMVQKGASAILCPSNNMLHYQRAQEYKHLHNKMRAKLAVEHKCMYISADVTGERDEQVSYGPTAAINPQGELVAQVPLGETGMICVDI